MLVKNHEDAGFGNQFNKYMFTYNHYRLSWYAFLDPLDIDYQVGFQCTACGDCPPIVVMDATSLAFRKDLMPWKSQLNGSGVHKTSSPISAVLEDKCKFSHVIKHCMYIMIIYIMIVLPELKQNKYLAKHACTDLFKT